MELHDTRTGGLVRSFEAGERIFMERSRKFSLRAMHGLASRAGLRVSAVNRRRL